MFDSENGAAEFANRRDGRIGAEDFALVCRDWLAGRIADACRRNAGGPSKTAIEPARGYGNVRAIQRWFQKYWLN